MENEQGKGERGECECVKETTVVLYPMRKIREKGMEKHWTKEKRLILVVAPIDGFVFSSRMRRDTIIT